MKLAIEYLLLTIGRRWPDNWADAIPVAGSIGRAHRMGSGVKARAEQRGVRRGRRGEDYNHGSNGFQGWDFIGARNHWLSKCVRGRRTTRNVDLNARRRIAIVALSSVECPDSIVPAFPPNTGIYGYSYVYTAADCDPSSLQTIVALQDNLACVLISDDPPLYASTNCEVDQPQGVLCFLVK